VERASTADRLRGSGGAPARVALLGGTRGLWAEAVAWMLSNEGYELVAAYDTVADLIAELDGLDAELVLIDLDDRPIDWVAIGRLRARRLNLKLILITVAITPEAAAAIRANHLDGVIEKAESAEQAGTTLLHVREGRRVYPSGWQDVARRGQLGGERLSARELTILELVSGGLRNGEIAKRLMISQNTVKFHLRSVYARLGVRNRIEAAQTFARMRDGDP
jgi:DNA-binding NarL/FixJ family response regulator